MKLLLDTHAFIWWATKKDSLSQSALGLCQDGDNDLLLSIVSLWEMQLKVQLGKLRFKLPLDELVEAQQLVNRLRLLQIEPQHVYALSQLPFHHKDPFDRLLLAQAVVENLPVLTADPAFSAYQVSVLW